MNTIDKQQVKLAAEICRKMADLEKDLSVTHNVRAHAIKSALKRTLNACGLIECKGCDEFAVEAMPKCEMCEDCLAADWYAEGYTDEDMSDMDEAGQIE